MINPMLGSARLALVLAVSLVASACGSSQTPAPTGPARFQVVLENAPRPVSLAIVDRTGLVVKVAASDQNTAANPAERDAFDGGNVFVRGGPGGTSVTVVWGSGTCSPTQAMLITASGDDWNVQIDPGPTVGEVCDMMLISLAVTISTSVLVDPTRVHASFVRGNA
jgi:hypothetical protein